MKEEIKTSVEYIIYKQWKPTVSVVKKYCEYRIVLLEARKNRLLFKMKNSKILMINLK